MLGLIWTLMDIAWHVNQASRYMWILNAPEISARQIVSPFASPRCRHCFAGLQANRIIVLRFIWKDSQVWTFLFGFFLTSQQLPFWKFGSDQSLRHIRGRKEVRSESPKAAGYPFHLWIIYESPTVVGNQSQHSESDLKEPLVITLVSGDASNLEHKWIEWTWNEMLDPLTSNDQYQNWLPCHLVPQIPCQSSNKVTHLPSGESWAVKRRLTEWLHLEEPHGSICCCSMHLGILGAD